MPISRLRLAFMLEIGGAAKNDRAESIHRPLTLTAMVLANPKNKTAIGLYRGGSELVAELRNLEFVPGKLA